MLASISANVYNDKEWVTKEYLRRCKAGMWKKQCTIDALNCWNLERSLDADLQGQDISVPLTMGELLKD